MSSIQQVSLIPYARKKSIEFFATNLRPDRDANFFFDDVDVNKYTQTASKITITTENATRYDVGEGIICESSNAYATIIKSVSPSTLYINDNYLTLKLSQYAASSLVSGTFTVGDIIYQTENNSDVYEENTFSAKVEHWFSSNAALVVSPLSGTANSASSTRVLHTVTTANKANLSSIQSLNRFPVASTIKSSSDAAKTAVVASYSHKHGVVSAPGTSTINLSSTYTVASPTPIKITEGSGLGQLSNIVSMSGSTATLDAPFAGLDSTSKYTLGSATVDDNGNLAGIFHLPETPTAKFKVGERVFTINDSDSVQSTNATMRAFAKYQSAGLTADIQAAAAASEAESSSTATTDGAATTSTGQVTVNQTTTTTTSTTTGQPGVTVTEPDPPPDNRGDPVVGPDNRFANFVIPNFAFRFPTDFRIPIGDPLAQTFFTPRGYGTFITSVDLFFKAKPLASNEDTEIPVSIGIVSTLNGYPTNKALATATVQCHDVKTTDGVSTFPRTTDATTKTKFTFADPVYLAPGNEYALVVYSDSPTYEVWLSELGSTIIGDTDGRRVSEQPYIGSLFKSQNASTWTPIQNEDLMFVINRAVFNKTPTTLTFGTEKLATDVPYDEILLNATEIEFPSANIDHKLKTTLFTTAATEANFRNIDPNKPFWFASATDSLTATGRRRLIPKSNTTALQTQVIVDTEDDTISPFFNAENYGVLVSQNLINNGELYATNITVTNPGFHDNVANVNVTISDSNLYPGVSGARATANVTLNNSGNVASINIINAGKGYVESPTITISEPGRTDNATAVIISEDSKYGGNALTRYITRRVTLADGFDSGDLRVTLRAIRPQGTNIIVYYKVQSSTDSRNFSDIKWRRMYLENDLVSPDLSTAIDFKYNPSDDPRINKLSYTEDGVTYPLGGTFKYFAIKIVMLAECGCAAPTVRNLRVIALPEG